MSNIKSNSDQQIKVSSKVLHNASIRFTYMLNAFSKINATQTNASFNSHFLVLWEQGGSQISLRVKETDRLLRQKQKSSRIIIIITC